MKSKIMNPNFGKSSLAAINKTLTNDRLPLNHRTVPIAPSYDARRLFEEQAAAAAYMPARKCVQLLVASISSATPLEPPKAS